MKSKGFTFIELLVVVAIISLLSSVVLASLQTAREKARIIKFRQEVYQLINAIEMYKNDYGKYPGETDDCQSYLHGSITAENGYPAIIPDQNCANNVKHFNLNNFLVPKYISKIPYPYTPGSWFNFRINLSRCMGDNVQVPYTILISSSVKGFENWSYFGGETGIDENTNYRCFSIK